ncbi:hypothetical protein L218DRAFT_944612 [Marasmius fiardii PR-910]|nr:hypothetical protein L218DRAFT_944612 [Marasmius fiardii PR-910]
MASSRNDRGGRPTLPSIRDMFREELGNTPRTRPESPSLTLARLRVDDDVSSMQNGLTNYPGDRRSSSSSTSAVRRPSLPPPPPSHFVDVPRGVPAYPPQAPYTYPPYTYPGTGSAQERTPVALYPAHHPILYDSRYPPAHDHRSSGRHTGNTVPMAGSYQHYDFPGSPNSQSYSHLMDPGPISGSKYECSYCGKGFNRPSSLKIHLNSHTGEKPFRCPVESCGRSFSVLSNMRRHARVHTQPSKDTSGDEGSDGHTPAQKPGSSTTSFADRWQHHRRDSSASTSSSGSRRSHSVSSDSGDEFDVPLPPEKRHRPSYGK